MSCYTPVDNGDVNKYNGGGWIASAEKMFHDDNNVSLGVCFICNGQPFKVMQNGVMYYPVVKHTQGIIGKIKTLFNTIFRPGSISLEKSIWVYYKEKYKEIVDDFNPDIIHVWGSESYSGLVAQVTNVPIVLHIQGIINPTVNAFLPPFMSWKDYTWIERQPKEILVNSVARKQWEMSCLRERTVFAGIYNYLGRTKWDERISHILNPESTYYHVDEFLRDCFYETRKRTIPEKLIIVTTISQPLYKGFDLVLKTAKLLKENLGIDFEWKCFGNINPEIIEKLTGIRHRDVNVKLLGIASAEQLLEAEISATCYFHPSYIDNSPNSVCEAQIQGVPVIVTYVGGVPSIVEDGVTGLIVPANDPYQSAYCVEKLYKNRDLNIRLGENAKVVAMKRHDKSAVRQQIMDVYISVADRN